VADSYKEPSIRVVIARERRLILRLAAVELRNRYAATALGTLWAVLQPVLLIAVFWFVFAFGLKLQMPATEAPFALMLIIGLVVWLGFSDSVLQSCNSVLQSAYLVRKIAFPIEILPMASVVGALSVHLASLVFVVAIIFATEHRISPNIFWLPFYFFSLSLFAVGLGYLLSALNVFQRDIGQSIGLVLQVWFWLTPIVWMPGIFSEPVQAWLELNPMAYVVDGYRYALTPDDIAPPSMREAFSFWVATGVSVVIGSWVFGRLKGEFADVL